MFQDDTYTESYISTIGVDFVSAHVVGVHVETFCGCVKFLYLRFHFSGLCQVISQQYTL